MIALYIVGGVLLFILLLLLIPVSAEVGYIDTVSVKVRYGGIKVFDNSAAKKPAKESPEKPAIESESKDKPKKENFISRIFKEKGKIEGIKFLFSVLKAALSRIIWVIRKIKISKLFLSILVASDDAATTAIAYGALCAVVCPVLNLIDQNTDIGVKEVNISTDFDKLSPEIELSVTAKTRLIYATVAAISMLFAYLKIKKESEKNERK